MNAFIEVFFALVAWSPPSILYTVPVLPGGRIPKHRHPTLEHEQYVLSGRMKVTLGDEVREVAAGQAVFIPAGTPHAYVNEGEEPVEFLCIIPKTSGYATEWLEG